MSTIRSLRQRATRLNAIIQSRNLYVTFPTLPYRVRVINAIVEDNSVTVEALYSGQRHNIDTATCMHDGDGWVVTL